MASEGVFLIRNGELLEMQHSQYATEAALQGLLADHPGLLPGRQINPSSPRKFLLIAREQGLPAVADGPDQWSVDHLFVDQDGIPTIVEVKRSTDTRIRREVVGQMLDYAANGVRNWPVERLRQDLTLRLGGGADAADSAVLEFLADTESQHLAADDFWRRVDGNLRAGRLRLLFVADAIPATLQRIIEFLNEQMTQCEVLGVEIRQYVADGHQVLAPTVIGQTSESRRLKGQGDTRGFDELLAASSEQVRWIDTRLAELAATRDWEVTTSRVGRQFRLPSGPTLVQLYPADEGGSLQFTMGVIHDAATQGLIAPPRAEHLQGQLDSFAGKPLSRRQPWTKVAPLHLHWQELERDWLPLYERAHRDVAAGAVRGGGPDPVART